MWEFACLTFSLSSDPQVFTKLVNVTCGCPAKQTGYSSVYSPGQHTDGQDRNSGLSTCRDSLQSFGGGRICDKLSEIQPDPTQQISKSKERVSEPPRFTNGHSAIAGRWLAFDPWDWCLQHQILGGQISPRIAKCSGRQGVQGNVGSSQLEARPPVFFHNRAVVGPITSQPLCFSVDDAASNILS
jgi:hypothetical protein